jgi:type 1 glutamine amidotransferase
MTIVNIFCRSDATNAASESRGIPAILSLVLSTFFTSVGCSDANVAPGATEETAESSGGQLGAGDGGSDSGGSCGVENPSGGTGGNQTQVGAGGGAVDEPPHDLKVLAIGELFVGESPEIHAPFVEAATTWLAGEENLNVTHIENPDPLTDEFLAEYDLIFQVNFTPFRWPESAKQAFQKYIEEGTGGWVGLHHAGLYGLGDDPWPWFYEFFGEITYQNYIGSFASATVHVEATAHPLFEGVPSTFEVTTDEWYTWNKSPRENVSVLANVDENSYSPSSDVKMGGDHPVIWTNESYAARNVYIFMGHHPNLFENPAYVTMLRNALNWAGTK